MFKTAFHIDQPLNKAGKKSKGRGPKLGFADGMPVLAIGPKGGKIVGWRFGKPIYAGSKAAGRLKSQKKAKAAAKGPSPKSVLKEHAQAVLDWLTGLGGKTVDHGGTPNPKYVMVDQATAQHITDSFGILPVQMGPARRFEVEALWKHVGEPFIPGDDELTAWAAKAAAGGLENPPFSEELLATLQPFTAEEEKKKFGKIIGKGSHGMKLVKDKTGKLYAWKKNSGQVWVSRAEEVFNRVAKLVSPKPHLVPDAELIEHDGQKGVLIGFMDAKDTIGNETSGDHGTTTKRLQEHFASLVQHQVLDWMMSNHDSHGGNFIITPKDELAAIDKGQAFKAIGKDKLSASYKLNNSAPTYNAMWKEFQAGKISGDPVKAVTEVIHNIEKNLSIEQYKAIVSPYLEELHAGLGDDPKKKWAAIKARFQNMRSDWEKHLTKMTGSKVVIPPLEVEAPAVTVVEDEKGAPDKPIQMPGWPMTIGAVTVHNPGASHPDGVVWPGKYPGPGYMSTITYKEKQYDFEFGVSGLGKMEVTVTLPDGKKLSYGSPQGAADALMLYSKDLPLDMSSSEKKKNGIAYSATKLFKLNKFADAFKAAASADPIPLSDTKEAMQKEKLKEIDAEVITIDKIVAALPDGPVTDTATMPIDVQDFVGEHGSPSVPDGWPEDMPPPGTIIKNTDVYGQSSIWGAKIEPVSGEPGWKQWKLYPEGKGPSDSNFDDPDYVYMGKHVPLVLKLLLDTPEVKALAEAAQASKLPPPPPPAPKAEVNIDGPGPKALDVKTPANAPKHHAGPLPPGHSHTVQKSFVNQKGMVDVTLAVSDSGIFSVSFFDDKKTLQTGDFKTLSAASDWLWVNQKGYTDSDDYKAKTGKKKVPSGGGWKFWGLKKKPAPPVATPAQVKAEDNFATMPESAPEDDAAKKKSIGVMAAKLSEIDAGAKFTDAEGVTWTVDEDGEWTDPWDTVITGFKLASHNQALIDQKGDPKTTNNPDFAAYPPGTVVIDSEMSNPQNHTYVKQPDGLWVRLANGVHWANNFLLEADTTWDVHFPPTPAGDAAPLSALSPPGAPEDTGTVQNPMTLSSSDLEALPIGTAFTIKPFPGKVAAYESRTITKVAENQWTVQLETADNTYTTLGTDESAAILITKEAVSQSVVQTSPTHEAPPAEVPELAWTGAKPPSEEELDSLPSSSIIVSSASGKHYKKQPNGTWMATGGTLGLTAKDTVKGGSKYTIQDQPGAIGWSGEKPPSLVELKALPVGAKLSGSGVELAGTSQVLTKAADDVWYSNLGTFTFTTEGVWAAGESWNVELPAGYKAVKPAKKVLDPAPAPESAITGTATPSIQGAPGPKVIKEKEELPDFAMKNKVWEMAEQWSNNLSGGGPHKMGDKSSNWDDWVPPSGVFLEGEVGGKKFYFTTTMPGYNGGQPASDVSFTVLDEKGTHHGTTFMSGPESALTEAFGKFGPYSWADIKKGFNLDQALFPAGENALTHITIPSLDEVVTTHASEIPASQKTKAVNAKLSIFDIVKQTETAAKYGGKIFLDEITKPGMAKKWPDSSYISFKNKDLSKPEAVQKLAAFIGDMGLDKLVTVQPTASKFGNGGAYVVIANQHLEIEKAVTTTVEEAAVASPPAAVEEAAPAPAGEGTKLVPGNKDANVLTLLDAPIGSTVTITSVGPSGTTVATYTKESADSWTTPVTPNYEWQAAALGNTIDLHTDEGDSIVLTSPAQTTTTAILADYKVPTVEELDALPVGSTVSPKYGDIDWKKNPMGNWDNMKTGWTLAPDTFIESEGKDTAWKAKLPPEPLTLQEGQSVVSTAAEMDKLPEGTELHFTNVVDTDFIGGGYKKKPGGDWVPINKPMSFIGLSADGVLGLGKEHDLGQLLYTKKAPSGWEGAKQVKGSDLDALPEGTTVQEVLSSGATAYSWTKQANGTWAREGDGFTTLASVIADDEKLQIVTKPPAQTMSSVKPSTLAKLKPGATLTFHTGVVWTKQDNQVWTEPKGHAGYPEDNHGLAYKVSNIGLAFDLQDVAGGKPAAEPAAPTGTPAELWTGKKMKKVSSHFKPYTIKKKLDALPVGVKLHLGDSTVLLKTEHGWQEALDETMVKTANVYDLGYAIYGKGATVEWPGTKVKKKPKPKPIPVAVKPKIPKVDSEAVQKAKAYQKWAKEAPKPNDNKSATLLAHFQKKVKDAGYAGGLYVHKDEEGTYYLGADNWEDFHGVVEKLKLKGVNVATPLGSSWAVDEKTLTKFLPEAKTIKGPDGAHYPKGTSFTETEVTTETLQEQIAGEATYPSGDEGKPKKIGAHNTDSDKVVIKFHGLGEDAQKKALEYLKEKGIEPAGEPMSGVATVIPVSKKALEKATKTEKQITPKIPDQPDAFVQAPPPFTIGAQTQGELHMPNEGDLGALDAIKIGAWGHSVQHGGPGLWMNYQCSARKIKNPSGEDYYEITGDLAKFDPDASSLNVGTVKYTFDSNNSMDPYNADEGTHLKGDSIIEGGWSGYEGKTDSGSEVLVIRDDHKSPGQDGALSFRNRFTVRVPVSKDVPTELTAALMKAGVPQEVATSSFDEKARRVFIKSQVLRQKLGAGGYWADDREKYSDEDWLDSKLTAVDKKVVASAEIRVGAGGAPTVWTNRITDEDLKEKGVRFVQTGNSNITNAIAMFKMGAGVPSRKQGYTNGTATSGASHTSDTKVGGATGTMCRISRTGVSGFGNVFGSGGAKFRWIYHPRILKRTDYYVHNGDSFGSIKSSPSSTSDAKKALSVTAGSNEALFEHGVAMEDVAGVWCNSASTRDTFIKALQKQGKEEVNGIPLEHFFYQSAESHVAMKSGCHGLKEGVLP